MLPDHTPLNDDFVNIIQHTYNVCSELLTDIL